MTEHLPTIILLVLLASYGYVLWRLSRGHLNFADFFRGPDNRASASRLIAIGGWIFASWVLVRDVLDGNYSEEYAMAYLGICVAGYALNKGSEAFSGKKDGS